MVVYLMANYVSLPKMVNSSMLFIVFSDEDLILEPRVQKLPFGCDI